MLLKTINIGCIAATIKVSRPKFYFLDLGLKPCADSLSLVLEVMCSGFRIS